MKQKSSLLMAAACSLQIARELTDQDEKVRKEKKKQHIYIKTNRLFLLFPCFNFFLCLEQRKSFLQVLDHVKDCRKVLQLINRNFNQGRSCLRKSANEILDIDIFPIKHQYRMQIHFITFNSIDLKAQSKLKRIK